jgi:hypothetical protein
MRQPGILTISDFLAGSLECNVQLDSYGVVIQSGAVLQAERWISRLTGAAREPSITAGGRTSLGWTRMLSAAVELGQQTQNLQIKPD